MRSRATRVSCEAPYSAPSRPPHATYTLAPELGGEVDVAHHLAQREPTDVAVVVGEAAGLEDRVREEVGRGGGDDEAGVGEALLEALDDGVARGVVAAEGDDVVVVEVDAVGAERGELLQRVDGVHLRPGGLTERVTPLPPDGPETEGELVLGGRGGDVDAHAVPSVSVPESGPAVRCARGGRRRPRGRGGWARPRGPWSRAVARWAARRVPGERPGRLPGGPQRDVLRRGRQRHGASQDRRCERAQRRRCGSRRRPAAGAVAARRVASTSRSTASASEHSRAS